MVSRPEGLHLKPLAEPYVRLSPHTAPVSQPLSQRHASERTTVGRQPSSYVAIQRYAVCVATVSLLPSGPALELPIDILEDRMHRRSIERPIVVPPPLYRGIALLREVFKRGRSSTMYLPTQHRLSHPFQRIVARCRQETGESPVVPAHCLSRSKRKTEEGKLHIRIS